MMMTVPKPKVKQPKTGPKGPRGRKKSVKQTNVTAPDQSSTHTQSRLYPVRFETPYEMTICFPSR